MKTVKDYICELDTDELVDMYFRKRSKRLSDYYDDYLYDDEDEERPDYASMTIVECAERDRKGIFDFIEYLKTIEITKSEGGRQGIIYAYNSIMRDDLHGKVCTEMLYRDDLLEDPEKCENYSYILSDRAEVLGFLVADNKFTQNNIYEVIADVMWEATWFGYRQEDIDDEVESLKASEEEIERGECKSFSSVDEMFTDILGEEEYTRMKDMQHKETEESQRLLDAAIHTRCEYDKSSMMRERMILLEALKNE